MSKLPEVETYLGFAAVQRQQLCQQILSAIDAVKLPNKVLLLCLCKPARSRFARARVILNSIRPAEEVRAARRAECPGGAQG